jgi:hypothetical protein
MLPRHKKKKPISETIADEHNGFSDIAERELQLKREMFDFDKRSIWRVVGFLGVLTTAVLTAVGALVNSIVTAQSNKRLELQKIQGALITDAIGTNDPAQSARNLLFLNELKLITLDPETKTALEHRSKNITVPVLPLAPKKEDDRDAKTDGIAKLLDSIRDYTSEFGDVDLNIERPNDPEYTKRYRQAEAKLDYIEVFAKSLGRTDLIRTFIEPRRNGIHQIQMRPNTRKQ